MLNEATRFTKLVVKKQEAITVKPKMVPEKQRDDQFNRVKKVVGKFCHASIGIPTRKIPLGGYQLPHGSQAKNCPLDKGN